MCERKGLSNPEKNLERIEMQMASERFDWFAFRCEAAKDILSSLCSFPPINYKVDVQQAINIADELIEKLKEIQ